MLTLPSQTEWNSLNNAEKALWLINREREDRGLAALHGLEENVAENIAVLWGGWTLPLERSVYLWMYNDSGSAWGHRHAILWYPYNDNSGSIGREGFLGIGHASGTHSGWSKSDIFVMNIFDPCSSL